MKNYRKKIAVIAAFAGLILAAFAGCSSKNNSDSSTSVDDALLRQPFTFSYGETSSDDSESASLDAQDPTSSKNDNESSSEDYVEVTNANGETVTEYVAVTDAAGEPVTEYITATEADGEPITGNNGEVVTTAVQVTTAIKKTEASKNNGNSSSTETTTASPVSDSYTPFTDEANAFWLDISKDQNFLFEDEFIAVTFKVKDNIPDGAYDIKITDPDFASIVGQTVKPEKVVDGKVFVNTTAEEPEDTSSITGLVVSADYVSCKQGDEITVNFRVKNNPGMCAMMFWFEYDKNAMEIVSCETTGTFADIAAQTSFGE